MLKRQLIDLANQRQTHLDAASAALEKGDRETYAKEMDQVKDLNTRIQEVQNLISEQERHIDHTTPAEVRDVAEERAEQLRNGDGVKFTAAEIRREIRNAYTLATGSLAAPTGVGTEIRDPVGNVVSSIIDQVSVADLTGLESYTEPYLISDLDAKGGKVSTNAGQARTASADPAFGAARIKPYELNVTSYVDRNLSRLTPVAYYNKIHAMAMRALRRAAAKLILLGDGQATPDMYGIQNAVNTSGAAIPTSVSVSAIDENTLDSIVFAYGSDEVLGAGARLLLTKKDLKALGALRGTNEKARLFRITMDQGNPNTGVIADGGLIVPFTICSDLKDFASASANGLTMSYGDPANYLLGLFGDYSIRVDESIKGVERMHTILGDVMIGGNVVVDKGFVNVKKVAAG